MDARYVNAFVLSTTNLFETMVGMSVKILKPFVKKESSTGNFVSGVIGFSGDATGSVVLCLPKNLAVKVASAFAGQDLDVDHPDFADAIGEMANMIAGGAKQHFEGMDVSISLPSVIIGEDHTVSISRHFPTVVIPCETEAGTFHVEVEIKEEARVPAATGARR